MKEALGQYGLHSEALSQNATVGCTGEISQLIKCLQPKYGDMKSNLQNTHKKSGAGDIHL